MDGWKTGLGPPADLSQTTTTSSNPIKKGTLLLPTDWTYRQVVGGKTTTSQTRPRIGCGGKSGGCNSSRGQEAEEEEDKPIAVRGRSASEPSFLSASRAVKVLRVASPANSPASSYTPPAVKGEFPIFPFFLFKFN